MASSSRLKWPFAAAAAVGLLEEGRHEGDEEDVDEDDVDDVDDDGDAGCLLLGAGHPW